MIRTRQKNEFNSGGFGKCQPHSSSDDSVFEFELLQLEGPKLTEVSFLKSICIYAYAHIVFMYLYYI